MKELLGGNEAIARGIYEAGVKVASAYPGTPSTEIFNTLPEYKDVMHCEWAPNEKVATEVAYGASMAGVRSCTALKMVGFNVAADPIFTAAYNGVNGGFVIIDADDPNMYSSQNEQDNRWYALHAKLPMVEPSDSQECKDFIIKAFEISEEFDIPVIFREVTRVAHSKGLVELGERQDVPDKEYVKNPKKFIATPANAYVHHVQLEEKLEKLYEFANKTDLNKMEINGSKVGVVSASIAYEYAKNAFPEDTSFLKLGFTNPMPIDLIKEFASKVDKLYVIEELDGYMEMQIKAAGIDCIGKEVIPKVHELTPNIIREAVGLDNPETKDVDVEAVSRPPALCPGCPHRGFYYSLHKIASSKEFEGRLIATGDIGCYTLGAAPPLAALDTCVCMGGGFSAGAGVAQAMKVTDRDYVVVGVLGDSTFFHSGMTGAVEIAYNNANMVPVVLDNHTTAMTGHQDNPGTGYNLEGEIAEKVKIEDILKAVGFEEVFIADPQNLKEMEETLLKAIHSDKRAAVISRRPCVLIKRYKTPKGLCEVDRDKCIGCKKCLSVGCAAISIVDGKSMIDENQCIGCTVCAQVCPVGAIRKVDK